MVIERRASGHLLAVWTLATPVGTGPNTRQAPVSFFGRVAEYFSLPADADLGFASFLCSNPVHNDCQTFYGHRDPYELRDLGAVMPRGWRMPAFTECRSSEGKNCALFLAGCRFAGNLNRTDEEVA